MIFHLLILLICLSPFFSFTAEKKPPVSGIVIALGNPNAMISEPVAPSSSAKKSPKQKTQPKSAPQKASKKSKASKSAAKKIVSKTVQETSSVSATQKVIRKKNDDIKTKKKNDSSKLEEQRKAKENAEAIKEAEEKRSQALAEEAAAKAEKAAQAKAKADAKSKFDGLFKGEGKSNDSKGNPKGRPNAKALEGMSQGAGTTGKGLGDRKLLFAPEITDNSQKTGKVIIEICVSNTGKVTKAKFTQKGSTTTDAHLISIAETNAKKYQFDKSTIQEQCGEIIIDFKLK